MAFDSRLLGGIGVLAAVGEIGNFVRAVYRYASRKLGRYGDAKVWYERSLAADPCRDAHDDQSPGCVLSRQ